MSSATFGPIFVTVAVFGFGILLFRGMVFEWHRRDREMRGDRS
jgi:hypothetical protein